MSEQWEMCKIGITDYHEQKIYSSSGIKVERTDYHSDDAIIKALSQGWEPFAVTNSPGGAHEGGVVYYFRRRIS